MAKTKKHDKKATAASASNRLLARRASSRRGAKDRALEVRDGQKVVFTLASGQRVEVWERAGMLSLRTGGRFVIEPDTCNQVYVKAV